MDKTRFTNGPQLDSEGFTMADARCHGCTPNEMCSRSGYCERAYSPLRYGAMPNPILDAVERVTLGADHGIYHGLRRA